MTDAFRDYLDYAADEAFKELKETGEYTLLSERALKVYEDLGVMLAPDIRTFVEESIDTLLEPESMESEFLYFRGYTDCVKLLKTLGVI